MTPQAAGSTPASTPSTDVPSSASAPAAPVMTPTVTPGECHWTEHTSPDGFKYYHNSLTRESRVRHIFETWLTVGDFALIS